MDAKERANFINSINVAERTDNKPAEEAVNKGSETQNMTNHQVMPEETDSIFALGLPEWDLEPPQVVVRRLRRI